jgi:hypothetical protein
MGDLNYTVGDIASRCSNDNRRGLKKLVHVTTEPEVNVIPAATELKITADITMSAAGGDLPAAGSFKQWNLASATGKNAFRVIAEGDEDSSQLKVEVDVNIPKVTAERVWAARGGCNHILLVPDQNDQIRLVGEKGNGATPTNYTETVNDEENSIKMTFVCYMSHPPYFYEGEIPA